MQDFIYDYLDTLGLIGLLGGLFVEALGVPFPGGIMIMFSGFLINQNYYNFYSVFLISLLGFNTGAFVAFSIGRYMGDPIFQRYGKCLRIDQPKLDQARDWLERSAPIFIIVGRFVPMVSNLTPYIAGASGLKRYKFVFYNFIFTVIWVAINISVGMVFGHNWQTIAGYFKNQVPLAVLALFFVYVVIKYIIRHVHTWRSEKV